MKIKKLNIGIHYIVMLVLTATLLVTLSYGWYVSNKTVTANGITATSASNDIKILKHDIYTYEDYNADAPYTTKNPNGVANPDVTGLLFGDKFYYTITIQTKDIKNKTISVQAMDIDGGEFFTVKNETVISANESHTEVEAGIYHTSIRVAEGVEPNITYKNVPKDYQLYTEANDTYIPKDEQGNLISNGKFYNVDLYGNYIEGSANGKEHYRVYIYEKNNASYNTCDLYKIKLSDVFIGSSYTKVSDLTGKVDGPYKDDYSFFDRSNKLSERIDRKTLCVYNNWLPQNESDTITFRFELVFDTTNINTNAPGINQSSFSNKNLIMNNIVVRSEVVA